MSEVISWNAQADCKCLCCRLGIAHRHRDSWKWKSQGKIKRKCTVCTHTEIRPKIVKEQTRHT